jgi:hypothetical protein
MVDQELTQAEWEQLELEAARARDAFLRSLAHSPELTALWSAWKFAERNAFEGRRARREAEARHPS